MLLGMEKKSLLFRVSRQRIRTTTTTTTTTTNNNNNSNNNNNNNNNNNESMSNVKITCQDLKKKVKITYVKNGKKK